MKQSEYKHEITLEMDNNKDQMSLHVFKMNSCEARHFSDVHLVSFALLLSKTFDIKNNKQKCIQPSQMKTPSHIGFGFRNVHCEIIGLI
jgi:hypothetical protein